MSGTLTGCSLDPAFRAALHVGLSILFLSAAVHKLRDLTAFTVALAGYALLPRSLVATVSPVIVAVEGTVGVGLLLPGRLPWAALLAAALLATYTTAIFINVRRGRRDIDCGCAGPTGRVPLSAALLIRNAGLIAATLLAALPAVPRPLVWLDAVTIGIGGAVLMLFYTAADTTLANAARQRAVSPGPSVDEFPAGSTERRQWSTL
jgi:hypothetical protein